MAIDYELAKRESPSIKAALTRATKITDPTKRMYAVIAACRKAVKAWDVWGAWPDQWSRWQRTLDDAIYAARRAGCESVNNLRLEDLE